MGHTYIYETDNREHQHTSEKRPALAKVISSHSVALYLVTSLCLEFIQLIVSSLPRQITHGFSSKGAYIIVFTQQAGQ